MDSAARQHTHHHHHLQRQTARACTGPLRRPIDSHRSRWCFHLDRTRPVHQLQAQRVTRYHPQRAQIRHHSMHQSLNRTRTCIAQHCSCMRRRNWHQRRRCTRTPPAAAVCRQAQRLGVHTQQELRCLADTHWRPHTPPYWRRSARSSRADQLGSQWFHGHSCQF